jgi:3-hydroxyacyl-[acyl-carrier-protein] dehydratase
MTSFGNLLECLPHKPPMRLVEEIVDVTPGEAARARRRAVPGDWYFDGHFPGTPVVPAVILVELLAQTGGIAAATGNDEEPSRQLRVAALGPFKFPAAAGPGVLLEASARVVARMGGLIKIEGEVTANGVLVAVGGVTLAEPRRA